MKKSQKEYFGHKGDKMIYGVQIYTLRKELKDEKSVKEVFDFLGSAGAKTVELAVMPDIAPKNLKKISEVNDVSICSSHSNLKEIKGNIYKLIADHLMYGAEFIGIGGMGKTKSIRGVRKFVKIFNEAAVIAERYGLKMCYHNHDWEFEKIGDTTAFDIMLKELNTNITFCLDCYWAYVGGQDVPALINKIGNRLSILHLKDYQKTSNGFKMCELGKGSLNLKEFITCAEKQGTKYSLVELDDSDDPMSEIKNSIKYLNTLFPAKDKK